MLKCFHPIFYCVFLINIQAEIIWHAKGCAIDGVVIHEIRDNLIQASVEWDQLGGLAILSFLIQKW
jgi:hypothetical protein